MISGASDDSNDVDFAPGTTSLSVGSRRSKRLMSNAGEGASKKVRPNVSSSDDSPGIAVVRFPDSEGEGRNSFVGLG